MTFTKTIAKNLLIAAALLAPSAAFGQFSTPMRDVENPDRFFFRASCDIYFSTGVSGSQTCSTNLGSTLGKSAVVDTVSIMCSSDDAATRFYSAGVTATWGGGGAVQFRPVLGDLVTVAGTHVNQGTVLTKLGIVVTPSSVSSLPWMGLQIRRNTTADDASCTMYVSGHTIP